MYIARLALSYGHKYPLENQLQNQKYKRGFHIIAVKRENKWIYSFKSDFIFEVGDLLIGLGPIETVDQWRSCVNPELSKEEK